jgi:very-short-patch-repair endonuclease
MGRFWALVRAQHFVVTFAQLVALGFSRDWIAHRVATGRLHRKFQGVYAVGRPDLTRQGLFVAAVLACGEGAAVSHAHAAELLGVGPEASGPIEISLPGRAGSHRGIRPHQRRAFQTTKRQRIRVTTITQTLVDMTLRLDRDGIEVMIGQADQRRLTNPEKLRKQLDLMPRQPGLGLLKRTLDRRDFVMTHSETERRFVPLAFAAGLSKPESQRHVGSYRVDFIWPQLNLVIEVDGLTYHRTAAQQAKDIVRAHDAARRGLITHRFTHEQVKYEPDYVVTTLQMIRRRLTGVEHT